MVARKTTPAKPSVEGRSDEEISAELDAKFGPTETVAKALEAAPATSWDSLAEDASYISPLDHLPDAVVKVFTETLDDYFKEITTPRGIVLGVNTPKMRTFKAASEEAAAELGQYAVTWALHQPMLVTAMVEQDEERLTFSFMPTAKASAASATRSDIAEVRAWAQATGLHMADRGRIPQTVWDAYDNRKV